VVKEDLKNQSLLFAGTEFSAYVSIDGGANWRRLNGLPTVPVHDLVIHPREADLIAATHGRSLWILDDITPLQQLTPAVLQSDLHLFKNKVATIWDRGQPRGHARAPDVPGTQSVDDCAAAACEFTDGAAELGGRLLLHEGRVGWASAD
jgi:hypothetical protein